MSIIIISSIILNYAVFNNYIFIRLNEPLAIATEESQKSAENIIEKGMESEEKLNYVKEKAGTERGNLTRIDQIKQLMNTWRQKPLMGWGYGSLAGNYFRSDPNNLPYAYEMVGFALLMKIWIVGILIWISFFGYLFWYILTELTTKAYDALPIICVIVALGVSTQFNPFLFTSSGMSILLFCFIEMKRMELEQSMRLGCTYLAKETVPFYKLPSTSLG